MIYSVKEHGQTRRKTGYRSKDLGYFLLPSIRNQNRYEILTTYSLYAFIFNGAKCRDKKVIVTLADTLGIQKKVRNALARHNFQIKEIDAIDTIQTFSAEVKGIPGYAIITAVISGTNVQLNGFYGFRRSDLFGYTTQPRNYKPIIYYDGSKMWHLLLYMRERWSR